ncbi:unnamed protein product [Meganyctiphanes norvegica]|uniref:B box-type domain-containing protein n=1 Tax=Meganyctiphanes norvegica TaxID=48144 RepID=A0AAV2SST4_MEGNR
MAECQNTECQRKEQQWLRHSKRQYRKIEDQDKKQNLLLSALFDSIIQQREEEIKELKEKVKELTGKRENKEGEDDRRNEENGKTCGKCEKKSKEHIECKVCELNLCEKCLMMNKSEMNEQKQQIDQIWICVECDYQQWEKENENEKRLQKEKEEPKMREPRIEEPRIE